MKPGLVEETWAQLHRKLSDMHLPNIHNMREAFVAGVYAAAAACTTERADSRDLSEAAARIERNR